MSAVDIGATQWWRPFLRWVWLIAVVLALAYALASEWSGVTAALGSMDAGRVAAAVIAGVVGVGVSGQIWRSLLAGLGAPLGVTVAIRIFFVGQLGKYLPGSVWPVLAQMELGRDHGVAPRVSAAGVALFLWVHLCSGAFLACLLLPLTGQFPAAVLLGAPAALLLVTPAVMARALALAVRLTRRPPLDRLPGMGAVACAVGWALLMWTLYGVHLWLLVEGVAGSGGISLGFTTGTFAAAWSVGFLFLIAPAGAGAREALLLALLPLATGPALAVVVVSRVALTLADGLWGSVGALSARNR